MIINFTQNYFLRRAVKLYGRKTGVVDGPYRLTYQEFDERVNRLSNALTDMGIKQGDRIAIIESNSHYLLEALYGIMFIGAVIVTINVRLFPREILYILKDVIISGGENIASIEIERAILSHSSVLEAAVIGFPDEKWGEVPKAIVVLKPGEAANENDLIQHCQKYLSRFKIPKSFDFVKSLPKSGTSKILKRELRERYWKGFEKRVH